MKTAWTKALKTFDYRLPEALTLLVLGAHGFSALSVRAAPPWHVWAVTAVVLLGLLGVARRLPVASSVPFALTLGLTWLLMATSGGTGSFFLAWLFVLALFYPAKLEPPLAAFVAPSIGIAYLLLLPLSGAGPPLLIVLSRALLLSVVGTSVYILARQLRLSLQRERALSEQKALTEWRFQRLVETLPGVTYALTPGEDVHYVSPQIGAILGFSEPEFRANPALHAERLHPEDRERILAAVKRSLETGERLSHEYRLLAKDGSVVWVQDHASLVRYGDGRSDELQGVMLDVTEQKLARAQAEATLRFQAELLDNLQDAVIATDEAFRIVSWNKGAEAIYGYRAEEALGVGALELFKTEFREGHRDSALAQLHAEGRWQDNVVQFTKGGEPRHIFALVSLTYDAEGTVSGSVGVNRDITELAEAQALVEATQSFLHQALDADPHAVFVKDAGGHFTFVNRAMADYYGLEPVDMLGKHDRDLALSGESVAAFEKLDQDVIRSRKAVIDTEVSVTNPVTGTTDYFQTTKAPLLAPDGEVEAVLTVTTDVSARVSAEQALRESEARYRAVVEDQTELISRLAPDGTLTFVNEAYAKLMGQPSASLVGHSLPDLLPENEGAYVLDKLAELTPERPVKTTIQRRVSSDGAEHWLEWTDQAIFDAEGKLSETQGVGRDVTARYRAEAALRESEAKYRGLLEQAVDGIFVTDVEMNLTLVNQAACRMTGYSEDELLGMKVTDLAAPETLTDLPSQREDLRSGKEVHTERLLRHKDGRVIPIEVRAKSLGDRHQSIVRDISARKAMEDALRLSEANYRGIVEDQTEFIVRLAPDYTVTFVNEAYSRFKGKSKEDLVGTNFLDNVFPKDRQGLLEKLSTLTPENPVASGEGRELNAQGEVAWLHINDRALFDEDGTLVQIQGVGRDITRRKQAEQAQAHLTERFSQIARVTSDIIWDLDIPSGELWWSDGVNTVLGYPFREVRPMSWWQTHVHPEDRARVLAEAERAQAAGEPNWTLEYRFQHASGDYLWIEERVSALYDAEGQTTRRIGAMTNITARKTYEWELHELTQRLIDAQETERRHIARELHDEIGQSLTAVKVACQLSDEDTPAKVKDGLAMLDGILDQVRGLSLSLHPAMLEDLGLLPALRHHVFQQAEGAGLKLALETNLGDEPLPDELQAAVYRVAQEALTNIIRHARARHVHVTLKRDPEALELCVSDDGVGLGAGQDGAGRSLGLRGMRERALLLGGRLELESKHRQGTTVRAVFPLEVEV